MGTFNYKLKMGASLGRPFRAVNGFVALVTGPRWGHCNFASRNNWYIATKLKTRN